MSDPREPGIASVVPPPPAVLPEGGSSSLADGEWHRMHPLTPLFKGGIALIIVAGIVISNMRDRVIAWMVSTFAPDEAEYVDYDGGDPVDWVLANNLVLVVMLGVLALVAVLIGIFWFVWRFQQFRITGDHVEVRKGLIFRSHRRAPLDRVQGVNLTRPFPARLIGLAKLEVVGAGTDANVPLEYLATARAESVRADILRLASGVRAARARREATAAGAAVAPGRRTELAGSINAGVSGLIEGVDLADVAPESVVKIPTGRIIGAQLLHVLVWAVFFAVVFLASFLPGVITALVDGRPPQEIAVVAVGVGLGVGIPMALAVIAIAWAQISRSLRYSIAPTPDGVRITYGLLTTVTETIPPGRIFAAEVTQSLLWRPFGWWAIKINRMSGKSAAQQQSGNAQQFNIVLPVGTRADVERVLSLILPDVPAGDIPLVWEHGILGPVGDDPYKTMPGRAWWRRPLSWRRHGYALTEFGVLLRRGIVWRKLAIFPLARLQGVSVSQGPIDRAQGVAEGRLHTVQGPISGGLSGLERADAMALLGVSRAAALAAARDQTHRWGEYAAASTPPLVAPPSPAAAVPPAPLPSAAPAAPPSPSVPPAPPMSPPSPPPGTGD